MKTYGIRYLGSKNNIIPLITEVIEALPIQEKTIIDVFTGTTRVAQAFRTLGYKVITSDLAWASEAYSSTFVCSEDMSHLKKYIDEMNKLEPVEGWITKNYCDVLGEKDNVVRVWKPKNGQKADAARDYIETLDISRKEKMYLITSIIFALDKVDNTVGLQQAYLKEWMSKRSDDVLEFKMLPKIEGPVGQHIVGDSLKINYPEAQVAYLDPPYTPADYSTYYHIWDSIVRWDKPKVGLKTNRRVDRIKSSTDWDSDMGSPWYSSKKALKATEELINKLPVKFCVFSYSDEGLIKLDEMKNLCSKYKSFVIHEKEHRRHIMSGIGAGAKDLTSEEKKNIEYVIVIEK